MDSPLLAFQAVSMTSMSDAAYAGLCFKIASECLTHLGTQSTVVAHCSLCVAFGLAISN